MLLALTDEGAPSYDPQVAEEIAAFGAPVFACTPDQFPDLMAAALRRDDIRGAASTDIKLVTGGLEPERDNAGIKGSGKTQSIGERLDIDPSGARCGCFLPDLTRLARRCPRQPLGEIT